MSIKNTEQLEAIIKYPYMSGIVLKSLHAIDKIKNTISHINAITDNIIKVYFMHFSFVL